MLHVRYRRNDLSRIRFVISPVRAVTEAARALADPRWSAAGTRRPLRGSRSPAAVPLAISVLRLDPPPRDLLAPIARGEYASPTLTAEIAAIRAGWQGSPPAAVTAYLDAVRRFFDTCLADDWPRMRRHLESDLAFQSHLLVVRGIGHVLSRLHPAVGWVEDAGVDSDTTPSLVPGRDVLLMPSLFRRAPRLLSSADLPCSLLLYPSREQERFWEADDQSDDGALVELLGRARATALRGIGTGCTTTELARRMGVSLPTASIHVGMLRRAGLVSTHRHGRAVRHLLTELGSRLLETAGDQAGTAAATVPTHQQAG
ncbi:ArsR/SmtB family transcription factor [Couchioplanes azureus]|uniref:ArsR/SmtB family transcription factor n=1 Tax=Couchioplanes caeruleus TaxID=56438 RepID=UPI00167155A5|nr:helix-turn-helix domain-containing protein [Couchioplanes caeruleus]GGQ69868.1 ArsR family transcriptional regulator [Couchioplanes caeruleus subsp. azureus]